MKDFLINAAAEGELVAALVRHQRQWGHTGRDLHAEFVAAFGGIRLRTMSYPVWRADYRLYVMPVVPYTIYFLDLPAAVWVAAIAHHRRRTGYWTRRRPPRR